ncbi:MAG: hypothetical protein JO243_02125 [Solirubrobacterales bacterium]|nr:hypothetical protein [Solirubrobacterales bacterium]
MTITATARRMLGPALIVAALAGCGATPPQPPLHQTKKLGASTGDISTECGLAYTITAFPGAHRAELLKLEASATRSARSLASVYARNPAWNYQGETVGQIVVDAVAMLRACGLSHAANALERATAHHRS